MFLLKKLIINDIFILKINKIFKSERNVFAEEINKIAVSSNDDKIVKSIDWIETYGYTTSKDLVNKKKRLNVAT